MVRLRKVCKFLSLFEQQAFGILESLYCLSVLLHYFEFASLLLPSSHKIYI